MVAISMKQVVLVSFVVFSHLFDHLPDVVIIKVSVANKDGLLEAKSLFSKWLDVFRLNLEYSRVVKRVSTVCVFYW